MTFQPIQDVLPDGRRFDSGYLDPLPEPDKKFDGRDWALRIMTRIKQGEHVPAIAERGAREVLAQPGVKP